ncbi:MAG: AAA family ATPase [Desulfobacteraceae bacterium]|nr:AAA family ATPase [Desulfobacteraceae bacterium]
MYSRLLELPPHPNQSFFLWGPRQTGKTTLLKERYPEALRIDLLQTDVLMRYLQRPALLREVVLPLPASQIVIIDEIQKAPALLDEVHFLIQEQQRVFILCGSNARKVRRGHANLLGGRALRHELFGLTAAELGPTFDLERMLNHGPLPSHYDHDQPALAIRSYVEDYLREEVFQEGLVRRLPHFSEFLRMAAIGDTGIVNLSNIARECGVAASTVRDHYQILVDTLLGAFLPAFTAKPKRRTLHAPKFYFRDIGVVNHLARRGWVSPGSELCGNAFENWLFHEISVHSRYCQRFYDICYWRLTTGVEVDFILGPAQVAIESKGKEKITAKDLKGLRQFREEYPKVQHLIAVSLDPLTRRTEDGIWIMPYSEFLRRLWDNEWQL